MGEQEREKGRSIYWTCGVLRRKLRTYPNMQYPNMGKYPNKISIYIVHIKC